MDVRGTKGETNPEVRALNTNRLPKSEEVVSENINEGVTNG